MNSFSSSRFNYCPVMLMFYSRTSRADTAFQRDQSKMQQSQLPSLTMKKNSIFKIRVSKYLTLYRLFSFFVCLNHDHVIKTSAQTFFTVKQSSQLQHYSIRETQYQHETKYFLYSLCYQILSTTQFLTAGKVLSADRLLFSILLTNLLRKVMQNLVNYIQTYKKDKNRNNI